MGWCAACSALACVDFCKQTLLIGVQLRGGTLCVVCMCPGVLQDVTRVVQKLFQGQLSHVTTCHTCNNPSDGSKREVEFYELSLQVQQMESLHHSLVRRSHAAAVIKEGSRLTTLPVLKMPPTVQYPAGCF